MDFFWWASGVSRSDPGMGRYVGSDALCSKINFELRDQRKYGFVPTVVKYWKRVVWCGTLQMVLFVPANCWRRKYNLEHIT
jgi:hypothetical protein